VPFNLPVLRVIDLWLVRRYFSSSLHILLTPYCRFSAPTSPVTSPAFQSIICSSHEGKEPGGSVLVLWRQRVVCAFENTEAGNQTTQLSGFVFDFWVRGYQYLEIFRGLLQFKHKLHCNRSFLRPSCLTLNILCSWNASVNKRRNR